MRLIFDIETNGLLEDMDKCHCLVIKDIDSGKIDTFTDVDEAIKYLESADVIIGHNVLDFDILALKLLKPSFNPPKVIDTLVYARLVWPDIRNDDASIEDFPVKLTGSHSLKAWGIRLGEHKGDYDGGWEHFSQEMLDYCIQDVETTHVLFKHLEDQKFPKMSIDLEHKVHSLCLEQERYGFMFDTGSAWSLVGDLTVERDTLEKELTNIFPTYTVSTPFLPAASNSKYGYVKGVMTEKHTTITFNPNSRVHIANRLEDKYNWKPKEFTPSGQAKIDEGILSKLPYPEAKSLAKYFLVQKRIAAIAEGKQAWLNNVKGDRIHGRVLTNQAVSGRATHRNPNMAQVPSVRVPYGRACRELFIVPEGKVLVGSDVSGLELRALSHFMHPKDNGAYAEVILNGDIHSHNQRLAGLETRDQAKTFIYALIFSAGAEKLGAIAGGNRAKGKKLKSQFLKELPALADLIQKVTTKAQQTKSLKGLDGRTLRVRSAHSSLNLLIQSAGALICKQWLIEIHKELNKLGWQDRCRQVAWVHDEVQFECDEQLGEQFGELAVRSIRKSGDFFNIRTQLDAEYKVGKSWAETH